MALTDSDIAFLNQQLRAKYKECSEPLRLEIEKTLQVTFGIKNLRNVQLWLRDGARMDNFVHKRLGQIELDMRVAFAQAFTSSSPLPSFKKDGSIHNEDLKKQGLKLREYLQNPVFVPRLSKLSFEFGGTIFWTMNASSSMPDDEYSTEELEADEFEDLVEEGEE